MIFMQPFPCLLIEIIVISPKNIYSSLNIGLSDADIAALYTHAREETNKKHNKVTINSL